MKKNNCYREHLLEHLDSVKDVNAMMDWIKEQPDLEQPDIFRVLRTILIERHEKTGETDYLEIAKLIEEGVDAFEEEILDAKLFKQMFIMAIEKTDLDQEKFTIVVTYLRENIIETILSNSGNTKKMRNTAENLIKLEKKSGLYDPDNWSAINI